MRPYSKYLSSLCIAFALVGCGGDSSDKSGQSTNQGTPNDIAHKATLDDLPKVAPEHQQAADAFIAKQLETLNALNCQQTPLPEGCQSVTTHFSDGAFDENKALDDQTILVIDYHDMRLPAILRYRSRIKAYYQLDKAHGIIPHNPSIETTAAVKDTLTAIDKRDFAPAQAYQALAGVVAKHNAKHQNTYGEVSHGLQYLLENNPKAGVVVVDIQKDLLETYKEAACSFNFGALKNNMSPVTKQVKQIISEYNVDFTYYVRNPILSQMDRYVLETLCNKKISEKNRYLIKDHIGEEHISWLSTNNTLGFSNATITDLRYPHKFSSNYLKTEYFYQLESPFDISGNLEKQEVININNDGVMIRSQDIFINLGFSRNNQYFNSTPAITFNAHGLSSAPANNMNYVMLSGPIALSYAIYTKNVEFPGEQMSNTLITQLKEKLTPKGCHDWSPKYSNEWKRGTCRLQDPLKFYQHEVFHLEYLLPQAN